MEVFTAALRIQLKCLPVLPDFSLLLGLGLSVRVPELLVFCL
jgi:hypothetical protein